MWTVSVGATAGVSPAVTTQIANITQAAADYWGRYIDHNLASIDIEISFVSLGSSTLAQAGTTYYFQQTIGSLDYYEPATIIELTTGTDQNGASPDIDIEINLDSINANEFNYGPLTDGVSLAGAPSKYDLWSILVHEIGHGLGMLTFLDEGGADRTTFDRYVTKSGVNYSFNGPDPNFGPIALDSSIAHVGNSIDSVLNAATGPGIAQYLTARDVSIFGDIGAPLKRPTNGNDDLSSFSTDSRFLSGNPAIHGLFGDDTINGLPGNDVLYGDEGNDSLNGASDDDRLFGGTGNDTLIGANGDDALFGEDGADFLFSGLGRDRADGGLGDDLIRTSNGNDTLIGGAGADTLGAGSGTDLLRGGDDADLLLGSNGKDRLYGDNGDDTLLGGSGRDVFFGGAGNDRLVGGANNDRFNFTPNGGADVITDFVAGAATDDVIGLIGWGTAFDSFTDVINAATQVGGDVVINLGAGDSITLQGVTLGSLHADDFVFG